MADDSGSIPPDTPLAGSQAASELEQQILLILVGLPGSSKSTFSNALVISSLEPEWSQARPATAESKRSAVRRRWTRVSQDEAPSRRRQECERQVIDALQRGENVVVDRVNFDPR
jgi:tRNA uridine 5-carbamoylmethylation protein Kti12